MLSRLKTWSQATSAGAVVAQNVVVGIAFALLAELVLYPRLGSGARATPVFPTAGLALVAVWLLGPRTLPGIGVAAVLVASLRLPPLLALTAGFSPVLGAMVGVRILQRLGFEDRLERVRDPLILALAAAPAGAITSATISTTVFFLNGASPANLASSWLLWMIRDWLGVATFAPLALAWMRARPFASTTPRLIEAGALVATMVALSQVMLVLWAGPSRAAPMGFLALPFVVWAALRFGARGAATVVAIMTALAMAIVMIGLGPVSMLSVEAGQLLTGAFLLLAAVTGQLLAAMKTERDDALAKRAYLEDQLRHSQKMEAVGRLAGGVAHDFNNLLTAILGYTDIVLHGMSPTDPPSRRRRTDQPRCAARRGTDATHAVVQPPREAQGDRAQPEHRAREGRADAAAGDWGGHQARDQPQGQPGAGPRRCRTARTGDPEPGRQRARCDAQRRPAHGGDLGRRAGRDALLRGFPTRVPASSCSSRCRTPARACHRRSARACSSRTSPPRRSARARVSGCPPPTASSVRVKGYITVASEVGLGTTFRVLLPRSDAEVAADPDSSVQKLPGGTEHVLVVEDDASVRRLAKDLLTRLGYSVTEAASGRAGIALGSDDTRHFDLALCDVILGDMSGPAVAEALVALRPSIRVLYMSGYTDDAIVRTGVLDEGKAFLQKPFTPVQLARKIRELLEARETDAA